MENFKVAKIGLTIEEKGMTFFSSILQQGIHLSVKVGCSLEHLLCDQMGVRPHYLSDRIKTVFLNGKPVDDYKTAIINHDDTIALSAAMPGLAGATFRRGGVLAAFRSTISHTNENHKIEICDRGMVILKLFNLLVREMGPSLLEMGFRVSVKTVKEWIDENPMEFSKYIRSINLDDHPMALDRFRTFDPAEKDQQAQVYVHVTS